MPHSLTSLARQWLLTPGARPPVVPALLWESPPGVDSAEGHWARTDGGRVPSAPGAGEALFFFVEKVPGAGNPFSMGVTIGRVSSNDVIIDHPSVSRFHAWLQQDERTGAWSVTDAESRNGTRVDGVSLSPRQRVALRDGGVIQLGEVSLTFFLPASALAEVKHRYERA